LMGHERQPRDDWEIRQGIPEQWEIEDIEAGKPPGGCPPPVPPPDSGHPEAAGTGGGQPPI
jgi:hypothetical protein